MPCPTPSPSRASPSSRRPLLSPSHRVPPHQRWSVCPPRRCCARCCCCQRSARRGCHPLILSCVCSPNTTITTLSEDWLCFDSFPT